MSFLSALPGLIKGGSKVARGIANIFDPSGGVSQKIKGVTGAAGNFAKDLGGMSFGGGGTAFEKASNIMGNIGDIAGSAGNMISGMGGAIGGRAGRGMQQAGGYMGMGGNAAQGARAMFDSGRGMIGLARDRGMAAKQQFGQGDFGGLANNVMGGVQDAMNFGGQMKRQVQNSFGPIGSSISNARRGKGSRA